MSIKPTPRELHSQEVKSRIVEQAKQLFIEYGYEKTGMNDIAKACGLTTGALYHHFKNKEDLLIEVFKTRSYRSPEAIEEFRNSKDPYNDLENFICGTMVDQILEDGVEFTRYRVFNVFKFRPDSEFDLCVKALVIRCQEEGIFTDKHPADVLTDFITCIYRSVSYQYAVSMVPVDPGALVRQRFDLAMEAIKI